MNVWTRLTELVSRLSALGAGAKLDDEFRLEMEAHLELLTEEYVRRGMTRDEARRRARLKFGGPAQLLQARRDQRGFPRLEAFTTDLRFGARLLRKHPGITGVAVVALALGIGANNTVFTFVNAVLFRGLPVDEPERIVSIRNHDGAGRPLAMSYRDFVTHQSASTSFDGLAAFRRTGVTIQDEGLSPDHLQALFLSWDGFRLLGVAPILGRDFLPEDDRVEAPSVVMLGFNPWKNRYGGDPSILGRTITVNGTPAMVIGVMPEGFRFDYWAELWQPLARMPGLGDDPEARVLQTFGKLADTASLSRAQAEVDTIAARLDSSDPPARVTPFTGRLTSDPALLSLVGGVGFVLLIACANVANLLLARSSHREREIAIRLAIGATRGRIVRQLLTESAWLAALAGCAGFVLSVWGIRLLSGAVANIAKPYWIDWSMDARVFAFFAVLCLGTAILFSLAPALSLSNARGLRGVRSWSSALLIAEVALTLVLLTSAGSLLTSFVGLVRLDANLETSHLTTMALRLPGGKYGAREEQMRFLERLEERLSALEPISSFTMASTIPFAGAPSSELEIEGRPADAGTTPIASTVVVGSRYFETLGLRLVRGRAFTDLDGTPGQETAIVNELFVSTYFPGEDPIGRRIRLTGDAVHDWLTIEGVSETVRQRTLQEPDPVVYLPFRVSPGALSRLIVGTRGEPAAAVALLREEVRALDPDIPVHGIMTMDELLSQSRWPFRIYGVVFSVFAIIALVLSSIGLYAVTSNTVNERTHEIGLRMALGATSTGVSWLVSRRVLFEVAFGLALGIVGALGTGALLQSFLIQTDASDPSRLVSIVFILAAVASAAALTASRRASRLEPVVALRHE
jgi:predicted permease